MKYKTSPPICIGCSKPQTWKEFCIADYSGKGKINARVCGRDECRYIMSRICGATPQQIAEINNERKRLAKERGHLYVRFESIDQWMSIGKRT